MCSFQCFTGVSFGLAKSMVALPAAHRQAILQKRQHAKRPKDVTCQDRVNRLMLMVEQEAPPWKFQTASLVFSSSAAHRCEPWRQVGLATEQYGTQMSLQLSEHRNATCSVEPCIN